MHTPLEDGSLCTYYVVMILADGLIRMCYIFVRFVYSLFYFIGMFFFCLNECVP